ncbi:MAG: type IV pilus biogenesis/stability protein PilW [Nevskiaceae bacterium]|nr:MAG: type IV pilus biogenesis/stability protein PilW [Nevskiaceae bacterium]TAM20963.1 MAG: type IV pilus biogenesis/stability protein PilW [Nevskiaceae bacterium]
MKRLGVVLLLGLLSACVTEYGAGEKPIEPNFREAARANTQLGIEYARKGQFDLAIDKLKRALEQDSGYAPTHGALALLYAKRGEDVLAEQHYRRALSLDPKDPFARNNFAVFQCERGKVREGEHLLLETANDRGHGSPEAAWTNAGVCVRRSDPAKAERYFREALNVNPNYPDALMEMAGLAAQNHDWLRVRAFLQRRDRVAPATAQSLLLALQAERALGDRVTATNLEQRLRNEFPEVAVPR